MARQRRSVSDQPAQLPVPCGGRTSTLPQGYDAFLKDLKERIRSTQLKAAAAVNRELVLLYWNIGRDVLAQQQRYGWGAKVIDRLATDLRHAFPGVQGFSPRNLKYTRAFAQAWPDEAIVQQAAAQIPWFHNCILLDKVKDPAEREWYIRKTIEHGWSRAILDQQIDSDLYRRQGKAVNNFSRTLPPSQSDLAEQILKDPYNFDFLMLADDAHVTRAEGDNGTGRTVRGAVALKQFWPYSTSRRAFKGHLPYLEGVHYCTHSSLRLGQHFGRRQEGEFLPLITARKVAVVSRRARVPSRILIEQCCTWESPAGVPSRPH